MQYGMPTLIENKTLNDNIMLCKELGLNFIELNIADFNPLVRNAYLETTRRRQLTICSLPHALY